MTETTCVPKAKKPFAVMLSSTYSELIDHRRAVREAMLTQRLLPVAMEDDAALPGQDLISASLAKVDEADAYVGLVSYRYGQRPEDKDRNPDAISLTELEFRRAVFRKIPICMFLMHDDYPVPQRVIDEEKPETREKRASFVALVKNDRIFAEFKSVEDLKTKAVQSLVELRRVLEAPDAQQIGASIALSSRPIASAEELRLTFDNTHQSRRPCQGASVGDLNIELVREFASKVAPELIADQTTAEDTLPFRLGLLSAIPELGKLIPHNSAILCFCDSPQKYLPQARASFSVEGEDADEFVLKRVEGPLYRQITALIQLALNELRTKVSFDRSGRRVETPEIPNDVIREAISNAVSHRDYHQAATGNVQVRVRKDTIEITNPGSFPIDFSWDTLLDSDGVSSPNDAFVAYFLTIQLAFEGIGRGFRIFREYIKQNGTDAITFEKCPGPAIKVRIRRPQKIDPIIKSTAAASNIPITVPAQFFGREAEIAALEKSLRVQPGRVAITALHGLRGVGKSALVAAFAERHRADYHAAWWIRAETEPTMRADLANLGVRLGWVPAEAAEQVAIDTTLTKLGDDGDGVLLIYDNANNSREIQKYLPRRGAARIVVTSTAPDWRGIGTQVEIEVWPDDVGADYLVERSGRTGERDAALALSNALGGLPLAHEQAAAFCQRIGISLSEYLKRFEANPAKLPGTEQDAPYDYGRTVATTFALAIEAAAKVHPGAEPLIVYAALLAPEPIPLYLFSEAREQFGEPLASLLAGDGLDEAVVALLAFALVDREAIPDERDPAIVTDCIRLHRLVRQVASARRTGEPREDVTRAVVAALAAVVPDGIYNDPQAWRRMRRLDPLVLSLVEGTSLPEGVEQISARLLNASGAYRQAAFAAYSSARPYFERALRLSEKALGPDHPDTASSLNNLGALLNSQGDLAGARPYYERALGIREKALGPDHPDTATTLDNLGALLQAQGDLAGAQPYYERALGINEKALGPNHPNTALSLNNLGYLLQAQGDLVGARPYYERALGIREKALGPNHPDTAFSLNNLGALLRAQGDLPGARPYYERALGIREKALGPDHPDTATSLNNLGSLLQAQGDLAGARPYLERALGICERYLGIAHPTTRTVAGNTYRLLQQLKMAEEAAALGKKFDLSE